MREVQITGTPKLKNVLGKSFFQAAFSTARKSSYLQLWFLATGDGNDVDAPAGELGGQTRVLTFLADG